MVVHDLTAMPAVIADCGAAKTAPDRSDWHSILRQGNTSVAFIFVRAGYKRLWWLPELSHAVSAAPAGSSVQIIQKRKLTPGDAACVRAVSGRVHIHFMNSSDVEAGPSGGRECTGYLYWLETRWHSLPDQMYFMHEEPPDYLHLSAALASPHGFINVLHPSAAVLRCFPPPDASRGSTIHLRARTTYELPVSLGELLSELGLPTPTCVLTPCCANFRITRDAARTRTLADLRRVDAYIRGVDAEAHSTSNPHSARGARSAHGAHNVPASWPTRGMALGATWPPTRCHAMEHAWHLLFGAAPLLAPLPPRTSRVGTRKTFCCAHGRRAMGASWALPTCPQTESIPTSSARAALKRSGNVSASTAVHRAASLFAMQTIHALLWPDGRCAHAGHAPPHTPPHCAGASLLGGGTIVSMWNEARASSLSDLLPSVAPNNGDDGGAGMTSRAASTIRCTYEL